MFCRNCGEEIPVDSEFLYNSEYSCPKCGALVKSTTVNTNQDNADKTSPLGYFLGALKKYVVFKGRARRAEYWWFTLFNVILTVAASTLDIVCGFMITDDTGILYLLVTVALFLPSLSLSVRRYHDYDKRGWVMFIPIYSFVLLFFDGTPGENRFGDDPKGRGVTVSTVENDIE